MRRALTLFCLVFCPVLLAAQGQGSAPQSQPPADAAGPLPVRRVILYKTGVGYFEHLGDVRGRQSVTIRFNSAQLNDVLKSLTVLDLGKGQITGISYNSMAPLDERLGALRLPLGQTTTTLQVLGSLRGARIEVNAGAGPVEGRLLSVEQRQRERDGGRETVDVFTLVTTAGDIRTFDLTPAVRVRVVERDLRDEIGRYLDLVGSTREQDVRSMVISTAGTGERPLFVSYVSEVPIWKSTYRLILSDTRKPLLQGWAIVDNTIGEDWTNVELSLVAGAPQSFIQQISQPYYGRRPVVPMPPAVLLAPQTHQGTLGQGTGVVRGTVRDNGGGVLPGATVRLIGPSDEVTRTVTDQNGRYTLTAAPGTYQLRFELAGFATYVLPQWRMSAGGTAVQDAVMAVAGIEESVTVSGQSPAMARRNLSAVAGAAGGIPPPPPPALKDVAREAYNQAARDMAPHAAASELGDLFEYRIKEPITLGKNQSALVPIINAEIDAERVSLWNRGAGSGRPLRAVWLTNASGLTLDGGSMTLVDGNAFAGEGLLESLKPGERRLLSYAADLGVMVDARLQPGSGRVSRLRARDGLVIQENEERASWSYKVRNEDGTPRTIVVEHGLRPGWTLAEGQATAESTAGAERFKLAVAAKSEGSLDVREVRVGQTRITFGDITPRMIAQLVQSGLPAAVLERELRPILDKNAELRALDERLQAIQTERSAIAGEQQRLRENMKALRGSSEERALLQRYTRQLNDQEDRLEALQRDLAEVTSEREERSAELAELMRTMSFDITAGPALP